MKLEDKLKIPIFKWAIRMSVTDNESLTLERFKEALLKLAGKIRGKDKRIIDERPLVHEEYMDYNPREREKKLLSRY